MTRKEMDFIKKNRPPINEWSKEDEIKDREMSAISMIDSIICYGKKDISADEIFTDRYMERYIDDLGKDKVKDLIREQLWEEPVIAHNTYEDSEGLTYNTLFFKDDEEYWKYMSLDRKCDLLAEKCGDWDYRNGVDMTEPHLSGINVIGHNIYPMCELYSPDLEDYVLTEADMISDNILLEEFKNLNMDDKSYVLDFIGNVENHIDFNKVSDELYNKVQEELNDLEEEGDLDL